MSPRVAHVATGNTLGDMVPDGFHLRAEAASLIGRDAQTLKRWHRNGTFTATHYMEAGQLHCWLYSNDDIEALKRIARTVKPGRPPMHKKRANQTKSATRPSQGGRVKYPKKKRREAA